MSSATMKDLFADESSDEESVENDKPQTEKQQNDAPDDAAKVTDDKMQVEEKAAETENKEEEPAAKKPQIQEDDDEEDDDVEFNDADADIVGTSTRAKPSATSTAADTAQDESQTRKVPLSKSKKPVMMHVMENERPPANVSLHMTKLPGMLVGIQPEAFEQDLYSASVEEQEYNNVLHMIRWRYKRNSNGELERNDDGTLIRESNTRIVQWDDGSYTLHVGSEVFEVDSLTTKTASGFAGINGYLYQSQKATYSSLQDPDKDREPGGTVLECMGPITSKLTARPSSLQSDAHKNLTVAVRQRNMKKARIAEYVTQHDPEKEKADRIKYKEELEKASARKKHIGGGGVRRQRTPAMSRRYLEQDEDDEHYDSVNVGAIKRRGRDQDAFDYGDDSEDEEDLDNDWEQERLDAVVRKRKRAHQASQAKQEEDDDDDDDIVLGDDSSSDEEVINRVKVGASATKKRSHQAVLEDEDDD